MAQIKPSRIAIIGCGWLGLPLAEQLTANYIVKGSTTRREKMSQLEQLRIQSFLFKAGVENKTHIEALFEVDQLIITLPPSSRNPALLETYPERIQQILDYAKRGTVKRVFFTSSTGIYPNSSDWVYEHMPIVAETPKQHILLSAENKVQDSGISYVILRLAGLFGPGREPAHWYTGRENVPGGLTPINMVHQSDVINLIVKMLGRVEIENEIVNVCASEHPTKEVFYTQQCIKKGLKPAIWKATQDPFKLVSADKLFHQFGEQFRLSKVVVN